MGWRGVYKTECILYESDSFRVLVDSFLLSGDIKSYFKIFYMDLLSEVNGEESMRSFGLYYYLKTKGSFGELLIPLLLSPPALGEGPLLAELRISFILITCANIVSWGGLKVSLSKL